MKEIRTWRVSSPEPILYISAVRTLGYRIRSFRGTATGYASTTPLEKRLGAARCCTGFPFSSLAARRASYSSYVFGETRTVPDSRNRIFNRYPIGRISKASVSCGADSKPAGGMSTLQGEGLLVLKLSVGARAGLSAEVVAELVGRVSEARRGYRLTRASVCGEVMPWWRLLLRTSVQD